MSDVSLSRPAERAEEVIPILDFGPYLAGDDGSLEKLANELRFAQENVGFYFAINHVGCCGGVQTTASHNPASYNGFKISKINAQPVGQKTGLDEIRRYAALAVREKVVPQGGREDARDLWAAYRHHVHRFLDPSLIKHYQ